MNDAAPRGWSIFRSRRMAIVFLLGFSGGLPLLLAGGTLKQWLLDAHADVVRVGVITTAALPYNIKFLWAPLLDRYHLPLLGRRRGWLLACQLAVIATLVVTSTLDPRDASAAWWYAFAIAAAAASQDVMIDAYNADLLEPHERTAGMAAYVTGYRVAMLISGSLALIVADHLAWRAIYLGMAALMLVGVVATLVAEEPPVRDRPPRTLADAFVVPIRELFERLGWNALLVLGFIATYKLGDQFAQSITDAFYRDGIGFTKSEIGVISKAVGFCAIVGGSALAADLVARHGLRRMLVVFALVQATVHLGYLWMAVAGKNLAVYAVSNVLENAGFAMGTSALTAAIMGMCNPAVSATQMALLTSLTSIGGRALGAYAGDVEKAVGWPPFFGITMAMALPGIVLVALAMRRSPPTDRRSS